MQRRRGTAQVPARDRPLSGF